MIVKMVKKMFDSKKQNPSCTFGEEVVSYLYDEMTGAIKVEFENHLTNCSSCPDELAAFTSVRSKVKNWREVEFNGLATPLIEIPYEKDQNMQIPAATQDSVSWIERLSGILSLSPALMKTSGAFAALAIVLGLGWFLISSLSNKDINTAENIPGETKSNLVVDSEEKVSDAQKPREIEQDPVLVEDKSTPVEKSPVKVKQPSFKRTAKRKSSRARKRKAQPRPVPVREMPRLTEVLAVEQTDDEIRLTDMFDEVGSDK